MKKLVIRKKYERIISVFLLALMISGIISFALNIINLGFSDSFMKLCLKSWIEGFIIAFPSAFYLPKLIVKIMKLINFV